MTLAVSLGDPQVRAILLDIEGTTTPVDFVYRVLFPYARNHVERFVRQHHASEGIRADMARLRQEHAGDLERKLDPPRWREDSVDAQMESVVAYVRWLMDRDCKSTGLKSLQGRIWETGYRSGELRSQVYADVPPAMARWHGQGKDICIFSSGSVLAQKLLFANTTAGDLTPLIHGYFDTTTGAKGDAESYRRIATAMGRPASEIAFVSDVVAELDAARLAGMKTALCVRPGSAEPAAGAHPVIRTFEGV